MKLTILGSSSALPTSERYPSAHVLNAHERLYLIDCGEGTQMQLRRNRIKISSINHIFISHLHGDHIFGLYGLISTFNLTGRKQPLNLYVPGNYQNILPSHLKDFDINLNFEIKFISLRGKDPIQILDDKYLTVCAFPLKHRIPSFGFIFREKILDRNITKESIEFYHIPISAIHRIKKGDDFITESGDIIKNELITYDPPKPLSFAYCSDTKYYERIASFVSGVDLLYHEATFDNSLRHLAIKTGHSTSIQAATVAKNAGAGKLLIGHFSARYKDISPLLDEARTIFPETLPAEDGKTYEVTAS
jgi:ribonuclease Z